jgi:hypothetical protein
MVTAIEEHKGYVSQWSVFIGGRNWSIGIKPSSSWLQVTDKCYHIRLYTS